MREKLTIFSPQKNTSLITATVLFLILVCLSLSALIGWTIWEERLDQLQEQAIAAENMSRSLAQHADDTFKATDTSLLGLSERLEFDGTAPEQLARLHKLLVLRVQELPQLQALSIMDKDGVRIVNSFIETDVYANNKNRPYFQYHLKHNDSGPHIDVPFQARSSGEWVIPLSRRINDKQGEFAGVVLATISVSYFSNFYQTFNIGKDGAIALVLTNGTQLLRQPLLADSLGKDLRKGSLFQRYLAGNNSGTAMIKSIQDGIERLNSYRHLEHYPVLVTAALSKHEILSNWYRMLIVRSAITCSIIIVLLMLGRRLIKQIRMRIHAEEEARNARDALKELNGTLEKLAQQDGLTGLANRRQFDTVIDAAIQRSRRSGAPLAMILIDVDYFKKFNDLYGHVAGDECLRQVARIIKSCEKRNDDLAARYGGEEFAMILPDTDLQGALVVAEAIRNAIRALKITHDGSTSGVVTISAGVDVRTNMTERDSAADFISSADQALYQAKTSGRDQIQVFGTA